MVWWGWSEEDRMHNIMHTEHGTSIKGHTYIQKRPHSHAVVALKVKTLRNNAHFAPDSKL